MARLHQKKTRVQLAAQVSRTGIRVRPYVNVSEHIYISENGDGACEHLKSQLLQHIHMHLPWVLSSFIERKMACGSLACGKPRHVQIVINGYNLTGMNLKLKSYESIYMGLIDSDP